MPMSPRLLRPGASGAFNPRSISDLALWLDGADSSSLYTTDAGPVTAVGAPTDIAGCALWLDGADSSAASMTLDGTAVSSWRDKSGNGRDFTASGSARPTLTNSGINGKSVLSFDGTDDRLSRASAMVTGNSGFTLFQVFEGTFPGNGTALFAHSSGAGGTDSNDISVGLSADQGSNWLFGTLRTRVSALRTGVTANSDQRFDSVNVAGVGVVSLVGSFSSTPTSTARFQGAQAPSSSGTSSLTSQVGMTIGCRNNATPDQFYVGKIAETIAYNTALSTADRARVEAYLAAKWGISGVHAQATAASDPVGYWGDKSGNNRHATQATAGNRPTLSVAARNSRNAVNMTGGACSVVATISLSQPNSYAFVYRTLATTTSAALFDGTSSRQNMNSATFGSGTDLQVFAGTANRPIGGALGLSQWRLVYASLDGASSVGSVDSPSTGFLIGNPGTSGIGTGIRIGALINQTSGHVGPIAEFLMFSRSLTAGEWTRLSRYLAAKWNIALAPQVSNADAQDWINRVYSNGGTVSTSTAAAVNDFCNAIDAGVGGVSMRDRFYRLNLFCGNSDASLAAVRTPLYRGQSLGGAQFGGTTDTNTGNLFQPNDYAETGLNGGLLGNGSTKHLNTGLNADAIPNLAQSGHLSVYAAGTFSSQIAIGVYAFTNPPFVITHESEIQTGPTTAGVFINSALAGPVTPTYTSPVFVVASRTSSTNIVAYANGVGGTASTATASMTNPASPFLVFARNLNGTATAHFGQRLRAYSIGEGMTGPQVSAFNTAMQAFQTALSRNA